MVVATALALVLTRSGDSSGRRGEVFLQSANSSGQDPFTESTARKATAAPLSAAPAGSAAPVNEVRGVDGGAPGLYSGTKNSPSCDVEQQIKYLQAAPSRNRAFASQAGVQPSGVPAYLRSLTPVQLRADTRVTAHGYRDGGTTTYQSVLQAGTAVLVDGHGVPRLRCACGNPLAPPVAQRTPRAVGTAWAGYRPANVVVVAPAAQIIKVFVVFDHEHDDWFGRHRGDHTGHDDRPARPPADPDPMNPPPDHGCPPASGRPGSPGPVVELPVVELPVVELPVVELPVVELVVLELAVLELAVLELAGVEAAALVRAAVLEAAVLRTALAGASEDRVAEDRVPEDRVAGVAAAEVAGTGLRAAVLRAAARPAVRCVAGLARTRVRGVLRRPGVLGPADAARLGGPRCAGAVTSAT
ncbi:MAG: hypothetical protein JF597_29870 [Streptomyces sp.]|uniref:DUF6777 domain-containing protein n=1 Tax=Streptomyces sp. TaxID=1931 RepID=UPI0025D3D277|nr:DUF6777 domain-containing protein [Streptomyces sp.]MBW8797638.1 hypothetical protein [Streptomyces sp.]